MTRVDDIFARQAVANRAASIASERPVAEVLAAQKAHADAAEAQADAVGDEDEDDDDE